MTAISPKRLSVLFACLALALMSLPVLAAPMTWTLGGYVQARFIDALGPVADTTSPSTFRDPRVALLVRANDNQHVLLQVFVASVGSTNAGTTGPNTPNSSSTFQIQHAFAEYYDGNYHARLGLSPVPFGYENPITASMLVTTERSQASNALFGNPGDKGNISLDKGLYLYYLPVKGFNASFGVVNGEAADTANDSNATKNIVARLGYALPGGQMGISTYNGTSSATAPSGSLDRSGFDIETTVGHVLFIGEYFDAETAGVRAQGGYLTAAYHGIAKQEPYLRLDYFAPNISSTTPDTFHRATVGYSYYLNPTSKAQLEYEAIKDNLTPALHGRVTGQYQIIF